MSGPGGASRDAEGRRVTEEIASVDRAIAALEAQRGTLGDAVVETALEPLRSRRAELAAPRAEQRRLVTVVFADLVDFTVLSRRLDPEDTREVVGAYFARWQQVIDAHGGVVEKFIGDAVMAVFGLSHSFEDDAHRAIRASLEMLEALTELNADLGPKYGVELHLRVGIDTGEVVVSTLGERKNHGFVAVGPTVNRASRLQASAPVDRVLVSADTQRQVRGAFVVETLPSLDLKGIDEPVDAFLVSYERRQEFRLDPSGGVEGVETETVGRDLQLRFLQERFWDVLDDSRLRMVTVMGDAGVGKSRLLFDFDAWLADRPEPVWWFRGRAAPTSQQGVNFLLRDLLTSRLDIQIDDTNDVVRERLHEGFVSAAGPLEGPRLAALVAAWLGFDVGDESENIPAEPQALRDRGTEALGEYFRHLSEQAPVLMLIEDLHWADEGTLRWLDAVAPVLSDAQVMVVATTRPTLLERHPRWGEGLGHHIRLPLTPLSRRESRALVHQILKHVEHLPDELVDLVIDSAEGNPFYVEELVTWLIDAGVVVRDEPHWHVVDELVRTVAVPSTLKGVLQARLDALSLEERNLLQRASVVGRVFWDQAVAHLDDRGLTDEEQTRQTLEHLRRREVLLQREVSRFAAAREFLFKHALLRDVAYDGVLRVHRERYHRLAADWLARTSAAVGRQDEYAAVIAEHYEQAGDPAAAEWYLRAGVDAVSVFALEEARRLLDSALELVGPGDVRLRFDILLEREELFDRVGEREEQQVALEGMLELEEQVDAPRRVRLFLTQSTVQFMHSDYAEARKHAARAVELATEIDHAELLAQATLAEGKARTWDADAEGAEVCLTQAVELSRKVGRPALLGESLRYLAMLAGNNSDYPASLDYARQAREVFARAGETELESTALAQMATTYFNMGHYAEAEAALEETLPIFRRSGHRYREAINLGNLASVALMRGHLASAEEWGQGALEITQQLEEIEAGATYRQVLGAVATMTSRLDQARDHMQEALSIARSVGADALAVETLARMVTIELAAGSSDAALAWAHEAVDVGERVTSDLDRGHAHLSLGYAASALERWDEADQAFATAAELFAGLELPALVRECTVGQACVAAARGQAVEAVTLVEPVLEHLDVTGLSGTAQPGSMLLTCHRVLLEAGDRRAAGVLSRAQRYLTAMAAEIGDPTLAAGYLAVPAHAALMGRS